MSTSEKDLGHNSDMEVDLVFEKPELNCELVKYIPPSKFGEETGNKDKEELETENVNVDLLFCLPSDIQFELIHIILGNAVDSLPDSIPVSEEHLYDEPVSSISIPLPPFHLPGYQSEPVLRGGISPEKEVLEKYEKHDNEDQLAENIKKESIAPVVAEDIGKEAELEKINDVNSPMGMNEQLAEAELQPISFEVQKETEPNAENDQNVDESIGNETEDEQDNIEEIPNPVFKSSGDATKTSESATNDVDAGEKKNIPKISITNGSETKQDAHFRSQAAQIIEDILARINKTSESNEVESKENDDPSFFDSSDEMELEDDVFYDDEPVETNDSEVEHFTFRLPETASTKENESDEVNRESAFGGSDQKTDDEVNFSVEGKEGDQSLELAENIIEHRSGSPSKNDIAEEKSEENIVSPINLFDSGKEVPETESFNELEKVPSSAEPMEEVEDNSSAYSLTSKDKIDIEETIPEVHEVEEVEDFVRDAPNSVASDQDNERTSIDVHGEDASGKNGSETIEVPESTNEPQSELKLVENEANTEVKESIDDLNETPKTAETKEEEVLHDVNESRLVCQQPLEDKIKPFDHEEINDRNADPAEPEQLENSVDGAPDLEDKEENERINDHVSGTSLLENDEKEQTGINESESAETIHEGLQNQEVDTIHLALEQSPENKDEEVKKSSDDQTIHTDGSALVLEGVENLNADDAEEGVPEREERTTASPGRSVDDDVNDAPSLAVEKEDNRTNPSDLSEDAVHDSIDPKVKNENKQADAAELSSNFKDGNAQEENPVDQSDDVESSGVLPVQPCTDSDEINKTENQEDSADTEKLDENSDAHEIVKFQISSFSDSISDNETVTESEKTENLLSGDGIDEAEKENSDDVDDKTEPIEEMKTEEEQENNDEPETAEGTASNGNNSGSLEVPEKMDDSIVPLVQQSNDEVQQIDESHEEKKNFEPTEQEKTDSELAEFSETAPSDNDRPLFVEDVHSQEEYPDDQQRNVLVSKLDEAEIAELESTEENIGNPNGIEAEQSLEVASSLDKHYETQHPEEEKDSISTATSLPTNDGDSKEDQTLITDDRRISDASETVEPDGKVRDSEDANIDRNDGTEQTILTDEARNSTDDVDNDSVEWSFQTNVNLLNTQEEYPAPEKEQDVIEATTIKTQGYDDVEQDPQQIFSPEDVEQAPGNDQLDKLADVLNSEVIEAEPVSKEKESDEIVRKEESADELGNIRDEFDILKTREKYPKTEGTENESVSVSPTELDEKVDSVSSSVLTIIEKTPDETDQVGRNADEEPMLVKKIVEQQLHEPEINVSEKTIDPESLNKTKLTSSQSPSSFKEKLTDIAQTDENTQKMDSTEVPEMAITELEINTTVEQDHQNEDIEAPKLNPEANSPVIKIPEIKKFKPLPNLIKPVMKKTKSIDAAIANLDLLAEPAPEPDIDVKPPIETKHSIYTIIENVHDPTADDKTNKKQKDDEKTLHVGNDYLPFGTETVPEDPFNKKDGNAEKRENEEKEVEVCVICDIVDDTSPHDIPIRQWKDEDVISLNSLKTLVAEVGCTIETERSVPEVIVSERIPEVEEPEETLKILKISPSESALMDIDIFDDPNIIVVPVPPPRASYNRMELKDDEDTNEETPQDMMRSVVTESELCDMAGKVLEEQQPEPSEEQQVVEPSMELEDERELSKTPTTFLEQPSNEELEKEQAPNAQNLSTVEPLNVLTEGLSVEHSLSPISPNTLAGYDEIPEMGITSIPNSPQEKLETDEENSECLDSIGDLSERTIQRFNSSFDDSVVRRDSFSSISSFGDRQKFRTAIDNIRQDLLPFQSSISQYLEPSNDQLLSRVTMDSPSDLSPNAPPVGFENPAAYFANLERNKDDKVATHDQPSGEGSLDSNEFEKVEHEGLDDYAHPDPMQQSVFGSLRGNEHDDRTNNSGQVASLNRYDDGFLLVELSEYERTPQSSKMSHDDVIEKNYFASGDDSTTAKLLESPIAEEARKLVRDAVESASDYAKTAHDAGDDIARELDADVNHGFENIQNKVSDLKDDFSEVIELPSPVKETIDKTHDNVSHLVHDKIPEAVDSAKSAIDDFVEEHKPEITEPVKQAVGDLYDIKDDVVEEAKPESIGTSVEQVHNEVDSFLKDVHRTPSPLSQSEFSADQPHFGDQTPEEEETTYDRRGPLTIPEELEKNDDEKDDLAEFDPLVVKNTAADFGSAVANALIEENDFEPPKFESVPRPPTPPKDITDEVVQPSSVNLGPAPTHSHPSTPHHSILKHRGNGEPWFDFKNVDPAILDLIYWRDPKKSAIALSLSLLALFIFAKFPLLSVLAYSGLGVLAATVGFRLFKTIEAQIKKTGGENPFQEILAQDLSLPQEKVHAQVDCLVEHGTYLANRVKKLVFVENILDSVKFGLLLWSLTYIASWFSGFTLIFLAIAGTFSIPKLYETYQEPIDAHLAVLNSHIQNVQNLLEEKIPFLRRAVVAEEKKDQ